MVVMEMTTGMMGNILALVTFDVCCIEIIFNTNEDSTSCSLPAG